MSNFQTLTDDQKALTLALVEAKAAALAAFMAVITQPQTPPRPQGWATRDEAEAMAEANRLQWLAECAKAEAEADRAYAAEGQAAYALGQAMAAHPGQYRWGEYLIESGRKSQGQWQRHAGDPVRLYRHNGRDLHLVGQHFDHHAAA